MDKPSNTKKSRRKKVVEPWLADLQALSFVASRDGKTAPLPVDGQSSRCFWNVTRTGDYGKDCAIGAELAGEYLRYVQTHRRGFLELIVADMPKERTGVEIGFLIIINYAVEGGPAYALRVNAYQRAEMDKLSAEEAR